MNGRVDVVSTIPFETATKDLDLNHGFASTSYSPPFQKFTLTVICDRGGIRIRFSSSMNWYGRSSSSSVPSLSKLGLVPGFVGIVIDEIEGWLPLSIKFFWSRVLQVHKVGLEINVFDNRLSKCTS